MDNSMQSRVLLKLRLQHPVNTSGGGGGGRTTKTPDGLKDIRESDYPLADEV